MDNSNSPNSPFPSSPLPDATPPPQPQPQQQPPSPPEPIAPPQIPNLPNAWDSASSIPSGTPFQPSSPPEPTDVSNPWSTAPAQPTNPQPDPVIQPQTLPSSPLDNPWGAPVQAPAFDGAATPAPTTEPSWIPNPPAPDLSQPVVEPTPQNQQPPFMQPEQAPTDLSHLISNNSAAETNGQSAQSPETLVVPSGNPDATTNIPVESHKSIPKWLIGVGIGLLLVVMGASAYFILGIGQAPKTQSVPAVQETTSTTIKPATPIATPPAASPQTASGSANFGQLGGSAPAATTPPQASSAADLLRQRK